MLSVGQLLFLCFLLAVSTVSAAMTPKTLYFAYGSNMLKSRLEERVGPVEVKGTATLSGYSVNYSKKSKDGSGKFNIIKDTAGSPTGIVYGRLFEVPAARIPVLDKFEGSQYAKTEVTVNTDSGPRKAVTYIGKPAYVSDKHLKPTAEYAKLVIDGAKEAQLPEAYIDHLRMAEIGKVGPFTRQNNLVPAQRTQQTTAVPQTSGAHQNVPAPIYFFTYGVNMSETSVQAKINGAVSMGVATLRGWKFNFHKKSVDRSGKCNMSESLSPQDRVVGKLYKIKADQKNALDAFNYAPSEYKSVSVQVQAGGQTYTAVAYVSRQDKLDKGMKPTAAYKKQTLAAIKTLGDDAYHTEISNLPAL